MVEDPTMTKLEAYEDIDINEPICPLDLGDH